LSFLYDKNGLDKAAATKGMTQTGEPNFYVKEINNIKTVYVYVMDDQYYCRYIVWKDVPENEKEMIADQLLDFCKEMKAYIASNQNTEIS